MDEETIPDATRTIWKVQNVTVESVIDAIEDPALEQLADGAAKDLLTRLAVAVQGSYEEQPDRAAVLLFEVPRPS